ncbi:MAG: divalent-cation tolerance protein CutA [Verrucomicrobiaceae bacterium]|nr:divalent-cation tolerance protein CutA [Verrucomicrobiaceae bacterium]
MNEVLVLFSTFPDMEKARYAATALVEAQLAACVNLLPAVESIYRWQGKTESAQEVLAIIKTSATALPRCEARLRELHPYEVPEIIALRPEHIAPSYEHWVLEETRP